MSKEHQNDKSIHSMGGEARAKSMTAEQRKECARNAANKRWTKGPEPGHQEISFSGKDGSRLHVRVSTSPKDFKLLTEILRLWSDRLEVPA